MTPANEAKVVEMTTLATATGGTHCSSRIMPEEIALHRSHVARIWRAYGLNPHLMKSLKLSRDPQFKEKLRNVVEPGVAPPQRAIVRAFREKRQFQALDRIQLGLPLKKGRKGTPTLDHKRHGTTLLFTALDVPTGDVIQECLPRHRREAFLRLLRRSTWKPIPSWTVAP